MRFSLYVFPLSAFFILAAAPSRACTCAPAQGAKIVKTMRDVADLQNNAATGSALIFEGKVEKQEVIEGPIGPPSNAMSMTMRGVHRVVTLRVSRAYRGKVEGIVTILTGFGNGDCGFDFETGKDYLVYANDLGEGVLFTSIGSGTTLMEEAGPQIRSLLGEAPTADDQLEPGSYYRKYEPQWTGRVCGRVVKPDGSPLAHASVDVTQLRGEHLPPNSAGDPKDSALDGTYCIGGISPGRYLLTAEFDDYRASTRWIGYYPGAIDHDRAVPLEVKEGTSLSGMDFAVRPQPVYTIRFRVVTPDGSPVPTDSLRVAIDSQSEDALGYHEDQGLEKDGTCALGLVPPGHYSVRTIVVPDSESGQVPADAARWQMADKQVDIGGEIEIVLTLTRKSNM